MPLAKKMAAGARPPWEQLSKEPLPDPCKCVTCDGSCERRVRKKWFQCNPCSKGYHGIPCDGYKPDRFPHLVPECEECGLLEVEH